MQKYRVSNRVPFSGFIILLIGIVVIGAVFGGSLYLIKRIFEYIPLYIIPIVYCGLAGFAFARFVHWGKVRNPLIAGVMGVLAGLAIPGTYHGIVYNVDFLSDLRRLAAEDGYQLTYSELNELANRILEAEVEHSGLPGFIILSARGGLSINSTRENYYLDQNQTLTYWALEALVMVAGIVILGAKAAQKPFDDSVGAWYLPNTSGIGAIPYDKRNSFYEALKAGDYRTARQYIVEKLPLPCVEATYRTSTPESEQVYIEVNEISVMNRRAAHRTVLRGIVNQNDFRMLQSEVKANTEKLYQAVSAAKATKRVKTPQSAKASGMTSPSSSTKRSGRRYYVIKR